MNFFSPFKPEKEFRIPTSRLKMVAELLDSSRSSALAD